MYEVQEKKADVQKTDGETDDEDILVAVEVAHGDTGRNAEDSERDRLGLAEVGDVDEGPVLGDDDEGVEVGESEVERELDKHWLDNLLRDCGRHGTHEVEEPDPCRNNDRLVGKEATCQDGALGELKLPEDDDKEEQAADYQHGNHRG